MLKFSFGEVKEICKKSANGDEIARKFLDYIDEDISRKAMNEYIAEETGREYGEVDSTRQYTDEALELIYGDFKKNNTKACEKVNRLGIDDKKRFYVIKERYDIQESSSKTRHFTDEELLWIHCGTLRTLNAAINLWHGLSGDDLERYDEINTPAWAHLFKKRDYTEQFLQGLNFQTMNGLRGIEFLNTLTGGDLHRYNEIMRSCS